MRSQTRYIGSPVLSLQTMLRTISFRHPVIPRLIPSGVFDEATLEAVMIFQREFYPPVTGRVDNDTWDAVVVLFQQALEELSEPRPCTGYPSRDYIILPDAQSVHLYIIQSMFKSLSAVLEEVEDCPVTGVHDAPCVRNVRWLQRLNGCRETGVMDKCAWDTLSRLYTIFVTYAQTPWLTRPEALSPPVRT